MDFLHESLRQVNLDGASEKFHHLKDELTTFLFESLHKINLLEQEVFQ